MQIDFHHAVTYVAARIAGFQHDEADIVAYAAQYVDDATGSGAVCFGNRAMYHRISSAHRTTNLRNLNDVDNHLVWLPFHFLPGNGGLPAGENPPGTFIDKLVACPDSPIARDMLDAAIADRKKAYGLHRLGVTMHVYADTWAHQGFAGVLHEINEVENARETGHSGQFGEGGLTGFFADVLDDAIPSLGHGRANILPDMPFLQWEYQDGRDTVKSRDNTDLFCAAADAMCKAMQAYRRADDASVEPIGIGDADMKKIRTLFETVVDKDGGERHRAWLNTIAAGDFSFGPAEISYADDGKKSWKAQALGTSQDLPVHEYKDGFLESNWKRFHDAVQAHRLAVLHDILPYYGICAG